MQRYRRDKYPGASYFFTVNTNRRQRVLTTPPFYNALKSAIKEVKTMYPFDIEAFVLLPDHLHCIWRMPESDADYSARWSLIKRKVSQRCREYLYGSVGINDSSEKRREIGLWQRRFWEHRIRDEKDFETHVNYIHYNPVKHGYVTKVKEWPYSSFHKYVRNGILPLDWCSAIKFNDGRFGEV
jgi:putative transposase